MTIIQALNRLKEPHRSLAFYNKKHHGLHVMRTGAYSIKDALFEGFIWPATPEGAEYWVNIFNNIEKYTMKDTKEEIKEARLELEKTTKRLEELEKQLNKEETWTPKGGESRNAGYGKTGAYVGGGYTSFGNAFSTIKEAENHSKRQKFYNWLCKLAQELNPSGEVGGDWFVYHAIGGRWSECRSYTIRDFCSMFETKAAAIEACRIMNRDKWVLPY